MKLLILGGTKFLGRAAAEAALARGHQVTLFNRGRTNPELFPEAEKLRGDRDGGLSALEGREWNAVIDPSGFVPRVVRASAELLRGAAEHYVFVSSMSVYEEPVSAGYDESSPLIAPADRTSEDFRSTPQAYGGLKALCEQAVAEVFPDAHANVRPGLVVGPNDPTGRFTYWPLRMAGRGEVLAPAPPERRVQFVDARDVGEWMVRLAEERGCGTFNAVCPPVTLGELFEMSRRIAGSDARVVWVDEEFLLEHDVQPWMELPLWIPGNDAAFLEADPSRALAAGLRIRPLEETVRDTLAWAQAKAASLVTGTAGMEPSREAELLAAWRER